VLFVHPPVDAIEDGARCGAWEARRSGTTLELSRAAGESGDHPVDDLDPLRALCGAAWNAPQEQDWTATGADDAAKAALAALGL
jgi:hypothetical protein